ncbi:hypothetical protein ACLB2K_020830 [Fragaria x ananassa]
MFDCSARDTVSIELPCACKFLIEVAPGTPRLFEKSTHDAPHSLSSFVRWHTPLSQEALTATISLHPAKDRGQNRNFARKPQAEFAYTFGPIHVVAPGTPCLFKKSRPDASHSLSSSARWHDSHSQEAMTTIVSPHPAEDRGQNIDTLSGTQEYK